MMLVRVTPAAATAVAQGAAPSARPFDIPTPVRGTVSSTSVLPAVDSSRFVVVNVSCCAVRAIGLAQEPGFRESVNRGRGAIVIAYAN